MKEKLLIRPLLESEIPIASHLVPQEWHFDMQQFLCTHFGEIYFHAFSGIIDEQLVCFGNVIINGKVGWLGNIIVDPQFRHNGIGFTITKFLVAYLKANGCTNQLLISTEAGKSIYQKAGFLTTSVYCFLKGQRFPSQPDSKYIRLIQTGDHSAIFFLDRQATGEERVYLLKKFIKNGWVHTGGPAGKIDGFYLPDFGSGLVIASSPLAGVNLLHLKHHLTDQNAVLPCDNKIAVDFLKHNYFRDYMLLPRMVMGDELEWKPEMIYSRAAGYCG